MYHTLFRRLLIKREIRPMAATNEIAGMKVVEIQGDKAIMDRKEYEFLMSKIADLEALVKKFEPKTVTITKEDLIRAASCSQNIDEIAKELGL